MYNGDTINYGPVTSSAITQTVQNFTVTAVPAAITVSQGHSQGNPSLGDAFIAPQTISLTEGLQNNFSDPLVLTCAITPLTTGLTCTPNGTTGATIAAAAGSSVPPGLYTVTYTVSDSKVPNLYQTATANLTVVNQPTTQVVVFSSGGTGTASFTAPLGLTGLSCNSQIATLISGTTPASYTTTTNQTLASIGIQCSNFASTGNGYTFTITAGTTTSRLEMAKSTIVLAGLGTPFLLMLGLLPVSRKLRKALLNGLAIFALGMLLMHATGCGSGGFPRSSAGTAATDGTYLLNVVNTQGTWAEVSLVVQD
jgi:hypothetical protein